MTQLIQRLQGIKDSRSMVGMLSRGKNVYNAAGRTPHQGRYSAVAKKRLKNGR